MYNGLCFTSSKIEPIYSPITPRKRSCMPENKEIKDSIHNAENIQRALLPSTEQLSLLPEHFVLFQPCLLYTSDAADE